MTVKYTGQIPACMVKYHLINTSVQGLDKKHIFRVGLIILITMNHAVVIIAFDFCLRGRRNVGSMAFRLA